MGSLALSIRDREVLHGRIGSLAAAFAAAGHRFFLVGGLVRDAVSGRGLSGDIDVTTDATPDQILSLIEGWADAVWDQGKAFGTIGARRAGTAVEITTHRAESYDTGSRKPLVRFSDDIRIDLSRRDFTVNAMAIEVPGWQLLDPFGGLEDLTKGVLRTPSAPRGLFCDDPLRMLRAARFSAQLGLTPTPELLSAVTCERARLEIVSRERIAAELTKLLALRRPAAGIRCLADTGLLGDLLPPWKESSVAVPADAVDAALAAVVTAGAVHETAGLREPDALVTARWAILLGPVCADHRVAARCLSALRLPGATVRQVSAILRAARSLEAAAQQPTQGPLTAADAAADGEGAPSHYTASDDDEANSCTASAGGEARRPVVRRLIVDHDTALDAAAAVLRAWGRPLPARFADHLGEVREAEGEALRRLPLNGHEVMEILGASGPVIGEALAWLRAAQVQHGPLSAQHARELLQTWHQPRAQTTPQTSSDAAERTTRHQHPTDNADDQPPPLDAAPSSTTCA